jgi:hypothetical protein
MERPPKEQGPMVPSQSSMPPLKPGQTLDTKSDYGKYWPGQPALFKLNDRDLVLAIPPEFNQFWIQRDRVVRAPAPVSKIPTAISLGFQMFMPDFSGYTPDNYKNEFHEDLVQIIAIEPADPAQAAPGAPGNHVPNTINRWIETGFLPKQHEEMYGLRCYVKKRPSDSSRYCFGERDKASGEMILLDVTAPPFEPWIVYPIMQASYYTSRNGGLIIVWRAHVKHLARWKDIDQQIWKYIEAWNIAPSITPTIPTTPSNTQLGK